MANWYGSARTNYVALADGVTLDMLKARLALLDVDLDIWPQRAQDGEPERVAFGPSQNSEDGAFPGFLYLDLDEDDEDDERIEPLMALFGYAPDEREAFLSDMTAGELEFDWTTAVMPLIKPGEVLVVQTIGAEKLRYLTGHAAAFIRRDSGEVEVVGVDLTSALHEKARQKFGLSEDYPITACEY